MNQSSNAGDLPVNYDTLDSPGSHHLLGQGQGLHDTANRQRNQDTQDTGELEFDPTDWNMDDVDDVDNVDDTDNVDNRDTVAEVLLDNRVYPASQQLPRNQDQIRSVPLENQILGYKHNRGYPPHQQLPRNQGHIRSLPLENQILGYGDNRGNQGYGDNRGYRGYPAAQQLYRNQGQIVSVPFQNQAMGYGDRIEQTLVGNLLVVLGKFNLHTVENVLICNFRAISAL